MIAGGQEIASDQKDCLLVNAYCSLHADGHLR
jgi:hypothetical protein